MNKMYFVAATLVIFMIFSITALAGTGEDAAALACTYEGVLKYEYGANDLNSATDCSGFVEQIYKAVGVSEIPRDSRSQAEFCTPVSEPEVGDLVFYAKKGKINHVAIYVGDGKIVHNNEKIVHKSDMNYREIEMFGRCY